MKLQILSKTNASGLQGVDGMVAGICSDDKNFYTAVDGGAIRKFPYTADELPQTSDDVFVFKDSHITCIDSTRDSTAPNTFIIGCSDGTFRLCSSNWRIDKTVNAHNGGVTCLKVNPDGSSIATAGEDGLVKIWSRTGILRSTLASCGSAITTLNWDSTGKYLMYSSGGNVTIRSASFKQDQVQIRAHRRLIVCSDWSRASNEIITGGEDCVARLFDSDGRQLAESQRFDYAVTSVGFLSGSKLCLIGTANRLYLTDSKLRVLSTLSIDAGCAICTSRDQPRAIVCGGFAVNLVAAVGKKIVYKDCEVIAETPRKLAVYDLKNGVNESLSFTDSVADFTIGFNNLIVITQSKVYIYKFGNWTSPVPVETKETAKVISQSSTMFACISDSGAQIIGYDGRTITRINEPRVKWDLLSPLMVACSPAVVVVVSPDDRKQIFAFSSSSGQLISSEPLIHSSEVRRISINQASSQAKTRFGFTNSNGDLTVCRLLSTNPRQPPTIEAQKLANFVDEFEWHSTHDVILARSENKLTVWCCPSAIFFTPELLPKLKIELRPLFDPAELDSFDGTHAFVRAKDGAFCVVPISPFLLMIHEAVEIQRNWKVVLQISRAMNDESLWAVCAACAVQAGEIDAAKEAYAALTMIDRVLFLEKVKKMKAPAARNAMIAVLQGRANEAEEILIQGGCIFRAIKMNISLCRWERALAIAKRTNKFIEVVAAYRTKFLNDMGMEENDPQFQKIGQAELSSVKNIIQEEKAKELNG